jgi:catechol 2,3-dioxygenase-like lactoylglutathione lyase family enzyme
MNLATKTESNVEQVVPFFWVRDIQDSLRFYVDGLGFTMTRQWIDEGQLRWCWLELGGTAVMVQEAGSGAQHQVTRDDARVGVNVYFMCKDALAIYRDLKSRGIEAKQPFVGNAMWVTEVADPDGHRLYFESPTDVAEETVFSEHGASG